ncbi:serine/threonine-protein kinase [Pyxidicoccus caerfyrddinensis]|uniref:serine/threonine-protein kinase n=1 Tax=Pyxidicoccus caerfyrddinensis TaxID=2709663 RepID=UPI0013D9FB7E|nr:serine/threonine-protein kinase [Pyxidicoccus caerfyrddinensis]
MNPPDALLGALVGQYRITRELARGGMGVVYEAVHEAIGQRAAVKVLQDLSGRASSRSRFLNEARAVSLVHHPGLVRVFDFGELPTGKPYILMELVEGESLRERLARGGPSLEVGTALRIARQIAAALCAVHARDIIHRDLKPENVMLVRDEEAAGGERVKLLDFGIARLVGDGSVRTTEGVVLGTALYMAPEQCAGSDDLDDRADVYALGVVLYELLAGGPPFQGEPTAVMRQHLFQEPPPLPERLRLPGELPALLRRMLAKEPSRRPRMVELAEALQQLERGVFVEAPGPDSRELARPPGGPDTRDGLPTVAERRPPPASLPPPSRRWPGGRVGAAVGVVLLAAPAAWVVTRKPEQPRAPALDGMVWLAGGVSAWAARPRS